MIALLLLFGSGAVVGGAAAGALSILKLPSRVSERFGTTRLPYVGSAALMAGALFASIMDIAGLTFNAGPFLQVFFVLGAGTFAGMLISALTEVVSVLPTCLTRLRLRSVLHPLLLAIAAGKLAGTLMNFLILKGG